MKDATGMLYTRVLHKIWHNNFECLKMLFIHNTMSISIRMINITSIVDNHGICRNHGTIRNACPKERERSDQSFPIRIDSYKEKNKKLPYVNLSKKHIHFPMDNDLFKRYIFLLLAKVEKD